MGLPFVVLVLGIILGLPFLLGVIWSIATLTAKH